MRLQALAFPAVLAVCMISATFAGKCIDLSRRRLLELDDSVLYELARDGITDMTGGVQCSISDVDVRGESGDCDLYVWVCPHAG